jgi:hypothetical protein
MLGRLNRLDVDLHAKFPELADELDLDAERAKVAAFKAELMGGLRPN